ncbi:IS110 family transposase [Actinacidiphila glaucinigra]
MSTSHKRIWVGIDAGKGHHWAVAVDADGEVPGHHAVGR